MTMQRRQHRGEVKAQVVLEALRGARTMHDMAADCGVHPRQMPQWKTVALEALPQLLSSRRGTQPQAEEALKAALYQQSGQWQVARDWLKKKVGLGP
jgi:transposase-like protein